MFKENAVKKEIAMETPAPLGYRRLDDDMAEKIIKDKVDLNLLGYRIKTPFYRTENDMRNLLYSIARLVLELKDRLEDYDTVLSDDASGRIISLIIRKIIVRKKAAKGEKTDIGYFVASGRDISHAVEKLVYSKKAEFGKTLFVTEYISTGLSIMDMIEILETNNIDFEIASLTLERELPSYSNDIRKHLIFGRDRSMSGLAFYKKKFTGDKKDGVSAHPIVNPKHERDDIVSARKDAELIADELYKLVE